MAIEGIKLKGVDQLTVLTSGPVSRKENTVPFVAGIIKFEHTVIGVEPVLGYDSNDNRCSGISIYLFEKDFDEPKSWIEKKLRAAGVRLAIWSWHDIDFRTGLTLMILPIGGLPRGQIAITPAVAALNLHLTDDFYRKGE